MSFLSNLFKSKIEHPPENSFFIQKQVGGALRFVGIFTNKYIDDDYPQEILKDSAHQTFVKKVNAGSAPMPELWVWHIKGSRIGVCDYLVYNDKGFIIATGTIDSGKEWVAKALQEYPEPLLMSHGMPINTIVHDKNDPRIITEYESREISPLPFISAANKITGFGFLPQTKTSERGERMAFSKEDKLKLEKLGIDATKLGNSVDDAAKLAEALGRESKEVTPEPKAETPETPETEAKETTTEAPAEPTAEAPENEGKETTAEPTAEPTAENVDAASDAPKTDEKETNLDEAEIVSRDELKALTDTIAQSMNDLMAQVKALSDDLNTVKASAEQQAESDEKARDEAIKKEMADTPAYSLASMFTASMVKGADETKVDGRTKEGRDAPAEAPAKNKNGFGIGFIDRLTQQ